MVFRWFLDYTKKPSLCSPYPAVKADQELCDRKRSHSLQVHHNTISSYLCMALDLFWNKTRHAFPLLDFFQHGVGTFMKGEDPTLSPTHYFLNATACEGEQNNH